MGDLTTPTVRRRLTKRHAPYWTRLARGRSLGFRRSETGAGTWYVRVHVGGDGSPYVSRALGTADDLAHVEADGEAILTYAQAIEAAIAWDPFETPAQRDSDAPETVGDAVRGYLAWYREHRRSYDRVKYQVNAHILPALGDLPLKKLTAGRLRAWLVELARKPARVRTASSADEARQRESHDERSRRATANRVWTILRAALNRAWKDGAIEGDPVWRRVESFRNAGRARTRYLEHEEIRRLLNAIDDRDFSALVRAALYTGARYGELCALEVEDVSLDSKSILVRTSKTGAGRHIFVNDEGLAFFDGLAAGRTNQELLLRRSDSKPWGSWQQRRRMQAACSASRIDPPITFHGLRHTYASLYLMGGGGLPDLAKQLGHTTTRMVEQHYGHLADSWRADRARQFAPSLGVKPPKTHRLRSGHS